MFFDESALGLCRALRVLPIENSTITVGFAVEDDIGDGAANELDGQVGCRTTGGCVEDVAGNRIS